MREREMRAGEEDAGEDGRPAEEREGNALEGKRNPPTSFPINRNRKEKEKEKRRRIKPRTLGLFFGFKIFIKRVLTWSLLILVTFLFINYFDYFQ
jgi:hypothetical protein